MNAAREKAQKSTNYASWKSTLNSTYGAKLNALSNRIESSLFCSAQEKALKKGAFNAPLCYLGKDYSMRVRMIILTLQTIL